MLVRSLLFTAFSVCASGATAQPVDVSVLLPLTCPDSSSATTCTTAKEGLQYRQTAEIAAQYVNNLNSTVQLKLSFVNTTGTEYGAWHAANSAASGGTARVIIGPSYSGPAKAASVAAQNSQVPMVLFDATSPALSQKDFVVRTCATDTLYSEATLAALQYFGWKQFAIVYSATSYARAFKEALALSVHKGSADLTIGASAEFATSPGTAQPGSAITQNEEIEFALDEIEKQNLRVVALLAHPADAKRVLTAANKRGMTGKGWLWFGPEWSTKEMWETEEGAEAQNAMRQLLKGSLGLVPDCNNDRLRKAISLPDTVSVANAGTLFDAIFLVHHTLAAPGGATLQGRALFNKLLDGTSTPSPVFDTNITIDSSTHARSNQNLQLVNMNPNAAHGGMYVQVGTFDAMSNALIVPDAGAIVWPGNQKAPPSDRALPSVSSQAVYFFIVLIGLVLAFVAESMLHERGIHVLSASGATIIVGMVAGGVVEAIGNTEMIDSAKFDEELFVLILLPIIVFESGFVMQRTHFFAQLGQIVTFALLGTLISTLFIGGLLNAVAPATLGAELPLEQAFAFAALISAVDPVATLSTFGVLKVEPSLNALVYGESIINDAMSIVLYRAFVGFFAEDVTVGAVFATVGRFIGISIGSVFFGLFVTVLCALTFKHAQLGNHENLEALVLLCFSYMSFAVSEAAHCSGIVAAVTAGIAMNHFAKTNVSRQGRQTSEGLLKILAFLADSVIFFLVGLNAVLYNRSISWSFIFATIVFCLIGRALNIFPLSAIMNMRVGVNRKLHIPINHQIAMWHAGLRGAIAYALAITFPSHHQNVIISTTSFVVLFTVFVLGGTTVPVLKKLNIRHGVEETHEDRERALSEAKEHSALKRWWLRFAKEKVQPWLLKDALARSTQDSLVLDDTVAGGQHNAELTAPSAWSMSDEMDDGRNSMGDLMGNVGNPALSLAPGDKKLNI